MRTIGVITTGRSDYGLYYPILKKIVSHPRLKLCLYVTGMHLSRRHGFTARFIKEDGFPIAARVSAVFSDTPPNIAKAMGKITLGFAEVFKKNQPDILVVLGDRFEMFAAAIAAVPFNIPMAHIHGGEISYGSIDEYFRHSLTKLSHLHFAATKTYAKRIKQMGEEPWRVIVSGAPGLDNICHMKKLSKKALERQYKIDLSKPALLITFHPVTTEHEKTKTYITALLTALKAYCDYTIIFTCPNSDTAGSIILKEIKSFTRVNRNSVLVDNFGQQGYLSMMQHAALMIGNSSSGIIEAASFKLPVVNIGTRQEGRIRAKNVIDVGYKADEIKRGIDKALSGAFRKSLKTLKNPCGDGKASERIVSVLSRVDLDKVKAKHFHDFKN